MFGFALKPDYSEAGQGGRDRNMTMDHRRTLWFGLMLSSAALALAAPAAAQSALSCSGAGVCVFSNGATSSRPFAYSDTGTAGSGSTAGSDGIGQTYEVESNLDLSLPYGSDTIALSIASTGGAGSSGGPSSGGAGGAITVEPAPSLLATSGANGVSTGGVSLWSLGGSGSDDNTNEGSDGGAGGDGGAVVYDGAASGITLLPATGFADPVAVFGLEAVSQGGTGGRGNYSPRLTPDGGAGGAGGAVTVTSGAITVGSTSAPFAGSDLAGLRAQSLGGRGPDATNSATGETEGGGGASTGGSGGGVSVTTTGAVSIFGAALEGAILGVQAESTGGAGGWAYDVGIDNDLTDGGDGGAGGKVRVEIGESVSLVQSGDSASLAPSAAVAARSTGGVGGVGQSGQTGGDGGAGDAAVVVVDPEAVVTATGTGVDAILARSQGGTGGAGLTDANNSTGGVGGDGGEVSVEVNDGATVTAAASAAGKDGGRGVVAQSVGYFGGPGGNGNAVFGQPGSAGAGGDGGPVTVEIATAGITTAGTDSVSSGLAFASGVLAQSIGGGGGDGGDFEGLFGGKGGAGGKGGDGGTVSVTSTGAITTSGINASGILAQSIGGGGGVGGVSDAVVVALGGDGGGGGASGKVQVVNQGTIATAGYAATGLQAQSIVGGGGAAGVSGAAISIGGSGGSDGGEVAGTVSVGNTGTIATSGDAASAIMAQSIGGGGGSAAGASSEAGSTSYGVFALGATGGAGGDGGTVTVTDIGTLSTAGDFSHGLLAQSIGGGGGSGGDAFAIGVLTAPAGAFGGQGAGGGDGGVVTVTNEIGGAVTTSGDGARAVFAQSVGGGGGAGGDATADTLLDDFTLSMGGSSSAAGKGSGASINLTGTTLTTIGDRAAAAVAQSIGGGGGSGGAGSSTSAGVVNFGLALGGLAGGGGAGGAATVMLAGSKITTGLPGDPTATQDSIGLLAQSVGGGGGTGGGAVAKALTTGVPIDPEDPEVTASFASEFAFGGVGGGGGAGGGATAAVSDGSTLVTAGAGSHGLLAQSVGGGGGAGGDASTGTVTVADTNSTYAIDIGVTMGGSGGNGGAGGAAAVTVGTTSPAETVTQVTTLGDQANAMVAQSVGGGGGSAGVPSTVTKDLFGATDLQIGITLGSANDLGQELGANGGSATATLLADGALATSGVGSRGILAQSVGGGGGTAQGAGVTLGASGSSGSSGGEEADDEDGSFSGTVTVQVGQTGAVGGSGGSASIATSAGSTITTQGTDADAMLIQSIGGGGGLGGSLGASDGDASPADTEEDDDTAVALDVQVGGAGGTGGNGGTVSVDVAGAASTQGDWADGLVAQSIGGGGGGGGTALASATGDSAQIDIGVGGAGGSGGAAGTITASFGRTASIATAGYMAQAALLQSIGGGGGQGGSGTSHATGEISVGAGAGQSGGASGDGGKVTANGQLTLATAGDDAHGLVAQSIGGGGGVGGAGTAESADGITDGDFGLDIAVGGGGGAAGNGGEVSLDLALTASTTGDRAAGLIAQSIGGGGGIGGAGTGSNLLAVTVGGSDGASGNGGPVSVTLAGANIQTQGAGAHGIIAQSIGGGGGIAGDLGAGSLSARDQTSGGDGSGQSVTVSTSGSVVVSGDNAIGLIAQSIGGGGGLMGDGSGLFATAASSQGTGDAGDVTVTVEGTLSATGAGGTGVFAQSLGPQGNGTVAVTVNGVLEGGDGGDAASLRIVDGRANRLAVGPSGRVQAGSSAVALRYRGGGSAAEGATLAVDNAGTISGSILGANAEGNDAITLVNRRTGILTGARRYQADILNEGELGIGASGRIDTTRIEGGYRQTGQVVADVDFAAGQSDRLVLLGEASLSGGVSARASTLLRDVSLPVIEGRSEFAAQVAAVDTPTVDYRTERVGTEILVSARDSHFGAAFAHQTRDQRNVGAHLDAIFDRGSRTYAGLLGTLSTASAAADGGASYLAALSSFEPAGSQAAAQTELARGRLGQGLACPRWTADALANGRCLWGDISTGRVDQDGSSGYDGTITLLAGGGEIMPTPEWRIGGAIGLETGDFHSDDGFTSSNGTSGYVAVGATRSLGALSLSFGVAGSYGRYDTSRRIVLPQVSPLAEGTSAVQSASARLRAAYDLPVGWGYARPLIDLDVVHVRAGGYDESGAGIYDLTVEDQSATSFLATPAIELGRAVALGNGWTGEGFLGLGVTFSSADSWQTVASLSQAPSGSGHFETEIPIADRIGRLEVGLRMRASETVQIEGGFEAEFGEDYGSQSGSILVRFLY